MKTKYKKMILLQSEGAQELPMLLAEQFSLMSTAGSLGEHYEQEPFTCHGPNFWEVLQLCNYKKHKTTRQKETHL